MIDTIIIDNFKSIKHAKFDLQKVNLFIGPNNSGKTNALNAITFVFNKLFFDISENSLKNNEWKNPSPGKLNRDSEGNLFITLNKQNIYSPSLTAKADTGFLNKNLYIKLSAIYKELDANAAKNAFFTVNVKNLKGKDIFYKVFTLKKVPDNVINKKISFESGMKLPLLLNGYSIKTYIWNKGGKRINLYKISVSIHEIEN